MANVFAAGVSRPPRAPATVQGGIPGPLIYVDMFRDARFVALFICNLVINFGYMVPFFYIPTYALSIGLTATGSAVCPAPPSVGRRVPADRWGRSPPLVRRVRWRVRETEGAALVSIVNGASFLGRIILGFVADLLGRINLYAVCMGIAALAVSIWPLGTTFATMVGLAPQASWAPLANPGSRLSRRTAAASMPGGRLRALWHFCRRLHLAAASDRRRPLWQRPAGRHLWHADVGVRTLPCKGLGGPLRAYGSPPTLCPSLAPCSSSVGQFGGPPIAGAIWDSTAPNFVPVSLFAGGMMLVAFLAVTAVAVRDRCRTRA